MAEVVPIEEEHRALIEPVLKEMMDESIWPDFDEMFSEVVYTYPTEVPYVTLKPVGDWPAMQFSCVTGEFMELTEWDYIQTVDVESQLESLEEEEYWNLVASILEYYHTIKWRTTADYMRIAKNRIENEEASSEYDETIYEYRCPAQTIYLTEEHYPITWGNQVVDDNLDWYMYNFDSSGVSDMVDSEDDSNLLTYKIPYEWKREEITDE